MRRAFTLIELLVVIGIIGLMVTVGVVSVQEGREYAALRGSVRSVYAAVRQARSIALVSQKPAVITFSSERNDDLTSSKVTITSVDLMKTRPNRAARSLNGEWRVLGEEAEESPGSAGKDNDGGGTVQDDGGQSVEEILFTPISGEVLTGVRIRVVMDEEEPEESTDKSEEIRRSRVSVFSNVDFLIASFRKGREKEKEKSAERKGTPAGDPSAPAETEELEPEKSVAWQTNGRCDAHKIYIYPDGGSVEDAWVIRVDRFGGVKVLEDGEE